MEGTDLEVFIMQQVCRYEVKRGYLEGERGRWRLSDGTCSSANTLPGPVDWLGFLARLQLSCSGSKEHSPNKAAKS